MRHTRAAVAGLILALMLTGCAGAEPRGGEYPNIVEPIPPSESEAPELPGHITRELGEGVTVDADVTYPGQDRYTCFATRAPELTAEFLTELFLSGDGSPQTVRQLEDPAEWPEYAGFFALETEAGSLVRWMNGTLSYSAPRPEGDEVRINSLQEVLWDLGQTEPVNDTELPGLSRAEALAKITGILERLDMIGTPEVAVFVGLDAAGMEARAAEVFAREDYEWLLEIGKLTELHDLTEADSGYYLRMDFTQEGLPLYGDGDRRVESAGEPLNVSDVSLEAYFLGGELTDIAIEGCYARTGAETRTESVIDLETLLEAVREKYELEILSVPMTFTRIYMEYLPYRVTSVDFDLRPYWVLEYGYEQEDGSVSLAGADRFNAVTGKDAAYGN